MGKKERLQHEVNKLASEPTYQAGKKSGWGGKLILLLLLGLLFSWIMLGGGSFFRN